MPKSWEMSNLNFEFFFQNWLRHINNSYLSVCLFSMLDIHLRKGRISIVGTSKLDIMNGWTPRNSQWVFTTSRFFCCCCLLLSTLHFSCAMIYDVVVTIFDPSLQLFHCFAGRLLNCCWCSLDGLVGLGWKNKQFLICIFAALDTSQKDKSGRKFAVIEGKQTP